jgi:hypothetical protein
MKLVARRVILLAGLFAACSEKPKTPSAISPKEDIRDFKASVGSVRALSGGRAGVEVGTLIPWRGSCGSWIVSSTWSNDKRELIVWIRSGKGDEDSPCGLHRSTSEFEALDDAPTGEWTLRVYYSYGDLVEDSAAEPNRLVSEIPFVLSRG